jgi:3-keto-5-aminohexanoate cleavage enzyme
MLAALSLGGNLRVGMEDTLTYGPKRPARDNAELVERAARLAAEAFRPAATPGQARTMLGLGPQGQE